LRNYNRLCRCVVIWIGLLFEEDSWRSCQQWWYPGSPIHWHCLDNFVLFSGIAIVFSDIVVLFFDSFVLFFDTFVLFVGIVVLFDIIIDSIINTVGNTVINSINIIILVRNANRLTEQ
jgi:hypothetical protein